jgi:hypothetical protein
MRTASFFLFGHADLLISCFNAGDAGCCPDFGLAFATGGFDPLIGAALIFVSLNFYFCTSFPALTKYLVKQCTVVIGNSSAILIALFSIATGKQRSEKMFSRELPEAVWQGRHPRDPSTTAHPACRDSRGAQEDRGKR